MTHRASRMLAFFLPLLLLTALISTPKVQASIGEDYGFGPRSASLGGASAEWNFDSFAGYNNPAGLPLINRSGTGFSNERFSFSYGIIDMDPEFLPIDNVVTANTYADGPMTPSISMGSVDTSYKSTFGQMFGAAWRADPQWMNLTLGMTLFFPFNQLAYIDTGNTLEPEYVLSRDRNQQPEITFAGGIQLNHWLRFGAGMSVAYTMTTSSDATLLQSSAGPSTAQLVTSIKPKVAPYFGLLVSSSSNASLGLVARLPSAETSNITVNSYFQPLGSLSTVPVTFGASDDIVYQPLSFELGGMLKTSRKTRTFLQVDYQAWSHFRAPYLLITSSTCSGCGLSVANGPNLDASYRDIIIPRIGEEISLTKTTRLRLGYAYQPSIFRSTPSGIGNYLDPSSHLINVGMGFVFNRFLGYHKPWNLDFSLDYQQLITETVTKSPGDENGDTGTPSDPKEKIGAPGYQAGGHVIGGEIALTLGI